LKHSSLPLSPAHTILSCCDAYIFDIDGTILKNRDRVHFNALNTAMADVYGKEATIAGVPYHGMTDIGILRAALARVGVNDHEFESRLPAALKRVREYVDQNCATLNPLVHPGIAEVLEDLQKKGKLLGVASGNLESVGWRKIEATGLRHYFRFGKFCDENEYRSGIFALAMNEVRSLLGASSTACFIGDTPQDIAASRHAGARIISVCTGHHQREELVALSPDLCIACCVDLLNGVQTDTPMLRP
jgi:phosphoglycolate phosphatase-like HAD superfamily hydrolase